MMIVHKRSITMTVGAMKSVARPMARMRVMVVSMCSRGGSSTALATRYVSCSSLRCKLTAPSTLFKVITVSTTSLVSSAHTVSMTCGDSASCLARNRSNGADR